MNRLAKIRMLQSVKDEAAYRANLEAAKELRRLATELPYTARESRKLFLDAAKSLERRPRVR